MKKNGDLATNLNSDFEFLEMNHTNFIIYRPYLLK